MGADVPSFDDSVESVVKESRLVGVSADYVTRTPSSVASNDGYVVRW